MKKTVISALTAIAVLPLMPIAGHGAKDNSSAYTIFGNGTIYINPDYAATNLVVSGGVVVAHNANPADYPGASFVNLNGGVAYPGFNDSHVHLLELGCMPPNFVNLIDCGSAAEIAAKVAEYAPSVPTNRPLLGFGFSLPVLSNRWTLADLALLDSAAGNHEVYLSDNLGHNCIVNSIVISNCNIIAASTVAPGGVIDEEGGVATGPLRESAMRLAAQHIFDQIPDDEVFTNTLALLNYWVSFGYTSIDDMMAGTGKRVMRPHIFREMENQGVLPLRVNYAYTIYSLADVESATNYLGHDTDMVRFLGVKIFIDGAFGAGQAWTTWPHVQGSTNGLHYFYSDDSCGTNYNLNRIVNKVDDLHLNIHYHIQGDAALDAVLNALDAVIAQKGKLSSVHTLIHMALPRNDQIQKMREYGTNLVVTTQPAFWKEEANADFYYGDMMTNTYPVMELINGGIMVGMSTDYAVSLLPDCPPLKMMFIGMSPSRWNPPTRTAITMRGLINGLTIGSAATTATNDIGTLEIGKKADFVVFNRNLYSVTPQELTNGTVMVLSCWVGGALKYKNNAIFQQACSDYDGDGKADPALYVKSAGNWYVRLSSMNYGLATLANFGGGTCQAVIGDFDGDGKTDPAVYHTESGDWYVLLSGSGYAPAIMEGFGGLSCQPAAGDYDGDGKADPAIYNSTNGNWQAAMSSREYALVSVDDFGGVGYTAIPEYYCADNVCHAAIYDQANGNWTILLLSPASHITWTLWDFGGVGYEPVPCDFDGDGLADPAIYQELTGNWSAKLSGSGYATARLTGFGGTGYITSAADFDGDRKADPALFEKATGNWHIKLSSQNYATVPLASGYTP